LQLPESGSVTPRQLTLIGDGIENPWNARTMLQAAAMFNGACLFRDRCDLAQAWTETVSARLALPVLSREALVRDFSPIVAVDNVDAADSVYGFRLTGGTAPAVVVGNERRGVAEDLLAAAQHAVQIPMVSRKLNCLNVAAASAVALYYMSRGGGGKLQLRSQPNKRRPEVLLIGAADHVELGSSIRSAGAFGWARIFVDDRQGVWFGCDRRTISEGRAAARQQRNPIRVVPMTVGRQYAFAEAYVVTLRPGDVPLHQADLARGPSQVIVIPDETAIDLEREDWASIARDVKFVQMSVPGKQFDYHYRLIASIALAEAARQVGQQSRPGRGRPKRHEPLYDRSLKLLSEDQGEIVSLEELENY
jgi:tRNA G18 (ribose-2'-O)-methylase SpoU